MTEAGLPMPLCVALNMHKGNRTTGYPFINECPLNLQARWLHNRLLALRIYGDYFCEFKYHKYLKTREFVYRNSFAPSLHIRTSMWETDEPMCFEEFVSWVAASFNFTKIM